MTVRAVEWKKPYTGWKAIEITEDKVINLKLRDENNLIIWDEWDNEIYVDLQLPDEIRPTDAFPVWVNTGRVIVDNWWDVSWTILVFKTTSGDNVKFLYWDDWKLYIDNGTWSFRQIYVKWEVDALLALKQDLLTAWDWISIDANNVISSTAIAIFSDTAPSNPVQWMLWYDTTASAMKIYDWSTWASIGWGGIPQYTATIQSNNVSYGTVDESTVTADLGAVISASWDELTIGNTTITATPESWYEFVSWTVNWWPLPTNLLSDVTITATFQLIITYQPVQYIQNTWAEWMDLWLWITSWVTSVDIKYNMVEWTPNKQQQVWWGMAVRPQWWTNTWFRTGYEGGWRTQWWLSTDTTWWNTDVVCTGTSTITSDRNIILFWQNEWGSAPTYYMNAIIKMYYCKVYENNVLVRDLVPVYRVSDNVVWMYDNVNDVFYTNANSTWGFVAWPDAN